MRRFEFNSVEPNNFIESLKKRLNQPMPGQEAQRLMTPLEHRNDRFDEGLMAKARPSGVLVLFYQREDRWYLPLTQRHDYKGPHSGQISFPGGKMEEQDPSIQFTALRETEEEIGVPASKVEIIGTLTDLFIPPSNFRVTPTVGVTQITPAFKLDPFEVKELIETPVDLLIHPDTIKSKIIRFSNGYEINTPYYDVFGKTVWGATAMMLSELIAVIETD